MNRRSTYFLVLPLLLLSFAGLMANGDTTVAHPSIWTPTPTINPTQQTTPSLIDPGGHIDDVTDVAFSLDDKTIFTSSADSTVRAWDVQTGKSTHVFFGHRNAVNSVATSPDGKTMATGSYDFTVRLWDISTGRLIRTLTTNPNLGIFSIVWRVAFSPDGKSVAAATEDGELEWDVSTGQVLPAFMRRYSNNFETTVLSYSPNGQTILALGEREYHFAMLLDARTGQLLQTYGSHAEQVTSAAFSPDGLYLLTDGKNGTVRLWNAASGRLLRIYTNGDIDGITSIAFAPDGKTFLTVSGDYMMRLWDVNTGHVLYPVQSQFGKVTSARFSHNGKSIAVAEGKAVRVLDTATGQPLNTFAAHGSPVWTVAFSPDGKTVATGHEDGTTHLWDVATGQLLRIIKGDQGHWPALAFSPDSKTILTSDKFYPTIRLWDVTTGTMLKYFSGNSVTHMAFSPSGKTFVAGGDDFFTSNGNVQMWNVETGSVLFTFNFQGNYPSGAVSFSPDGESVLVGGDYDGTAELLNAVSGAVIRKFKGHTREVLSVSFTADGKTALTTGGDGTARTWNIVTGNQISLERSTLARNGTISPDGRTVLTYGSDESARLWDANTWDLIHAYSHNYYVSDAVFSPDGTEILTASDDTSAALWDAKTGKLLKVFADAVDDGN